MGQIEKLEKVQRRATKLFSLQKSVTHVAFIVNLLFTLMEALLSMSRNDCILEMLLFQVI